MCCVHTLKCFIFIMKLLKREDSTAVITHCTFIASSGLKKAVLQQIATAAPFVLFITLLLQLLWMLLDIINPKNSASHRGHYTPNDTSMGHRLFSVILVHEKDKFSDDVLSWIHTFANLKTHLLTVFLIAKGSVSPLIQTFLFSFCVS